MKGYGRLQRILVLHKAGKISRYTAQQRLVQGRGQLNKAAYNLAIEEGLCLVCAKWDTCVVHDPAQYTEKNKCTWFVVIEK